MEYQLLTIQSILYVCTVALSVASPGPQSYFHSFGNKGTFTSFTRGASSGVHHKASVAAPVHQPSAYAPPAPAPVHHAPAAAYSAPAPTVKSFYHAPVAKPAAYSSPLPRPYVHHHQARPAYHQPTHHAPPRPHGPGIEYEREKCAIDYVEKEAEVCVPTFKTDCQKEDMKNGLVIKQEEECYQVTKTVCTETEEIVDQEVCAYSFNLVPVETEAKLVDVKWEKSCSDDTVCVNPHHTPGGYAAPTHCIEEYRHVCHLSPVLYPVIKKVVIKLPQPVETCINKQVLLPRLECDQVHERRCMLAPRTHPGPTIKLDKCEVVVGDQACSNTILQLPRQGCLQKITKLRTVYQVEEHVGVSYSG